MGLPWVRLDTQFASNPKLLELVAEKKWRAAFVYPASLAYSGSHGTCGYITDTAFPFIHATKAEANALVEVGLWLPAQGGWDINGWDEFQMVDEAAQKRRDRAKKAAAARWAKAGKAKLQSV